MAVVAAAHPGAPVAVLQVPAQGLLDAAAEIVPRLPAQFPPDLRRVDGIAPVMAGAVLHEADLFTVIGRTWLKFIQPLADQVDDVEVAPLVAAADVVDLARNAPFDHRLDATAVILHVQPVAHVLPVAVDGYRLAFQRIEDHQRYQFLGKLVGTVIVGAVGGQHRQPPGVMPGAHQVIGSRLGRRIGTVGCVGVRFRERRIIRRQAAVDLVGGDMQEALAF